MKEKSQTSKPNILDITINAQREAEHKLTSGEMLLDEQKDNYNRRLGIRKRKRNRKERTRKMSKEYTGPEVEVVKGLVETFNPITANKKQIRELRKALGNLSKAKYPKSEKAKKKEFPKNLKKSDKE